MADLLRSREPRSLLQLALLGQFQHIPCGCPCTMQVAHPDRSDPHLQVHSEPRALGAGGTTEPLGC